MNERLLLYKRLDWSSTGCNIIILRINYVLYLNQDYSNLFYKQNEWLLLYKRLDWSYISCDIIISRINYILYLDQDYYKNSNLFYNPNERLLLYKRIIGNIIKCIIAEGLNSWKYLVLKYVFCLHFQSERHFVFLSLVDVLNSIFPCFHVFCLARHVSHSYGWHL